MASSLDNISIFTEPWNNLKRTDCNTKERFSTTSKNRTIIFSNRFRRRDLTIVYMNKFIVQNCKNSDSIKAIRGILLFNLKLTDWCN